MPFHGEMYQPHCGSEYCASMPSDMLCVLKIPPMPVRPHALVLPPLVISGGWVTVVLVPLPQDQSPASEGISAHCMPRVTSAPRGNDGGYMVRSFVPGVRAI